MIAANEDEIRFSNGALYVSALHPAGTAAGSKLHIDGAHVLHSNISYSHIHESPAVTTQLLTVRGQAEFLSDVVIDGSVTVHGTVIGSGPYVDSSDVRFKTNITQLQGALKIVGKLKGVRTATVCLSLNDCGNMLNFFTRGLSIALVWRSIHIVNWGNVVVFVFTGELQLQNRRVSYTQIPFIPTDRLVG